jgi:hypothetical protein
MQIWTFHSGLAVSFVSVSRFGGRRNSDRRSFGDRFGRKYIIWISILAALYVALPYANLFWTGILSVIIGVVIASAFRQF